MNSYFSNATLDSQFLNAVNRMSLGTSTSRYQQPSSPRSSNSSTITITPSTIEPPIDFINGIISAVTKEKDTLLQCGNCQEGASAFSRCLDCSDLLCDTCVEAHQRVRLTKDHTIARFPKPITPPRSSRTSSESMSNLSQRSTSPCNGADNACENQNYNEMYYSPIPNCNDNPTLGGPSEYDLLYMSEAIEAAKMTNETLDMETSSAMISIRQAYDNVQHMLGSVEQRSIQTANEVQVAMKRYFVALEEREMELLNMIDQSRSFKGQMLTTQMDNLRVALAKLARVFDIIQSSKELSNPMDLIAMNSRALNELKKIRSLKSELVPCEDDMIAFVSPDNGFLSAVSSMGTISISSPTSPPSEPEYIINILNELKLNPDIFRPRRNRPIYGIARTVVVKKTTPLLYLSFGSEGEQDGQLCRPWGVCCDRMGHIIVADRSNNRIQVFDGLGNFLYKFGSQGTGPSQFDRPAGVTVSPEGNIIVADKDNHRIQVFKVDGTFLHKFGEKGSMNGQFNYPWDVACNALGHIVVTDTRNHRIQLFTSDGVYLNKYGFEGSVPMWKHFDSPRSVCFTPIGNIVVSDFNNHRLVVLDENLKQAQFLGHEGSKDQEFLRPQGVVSDDDGNIIVADSRNNRIQVLNRKGQYMWKTGQPGKKLGELDRPSGICLNPNGRIVVIDFGNSRVQIM